MNRLQFETSPYLLQHAGNPVDWYPWGEEAFEKAQRENKPVLVSIGYSSCHWCHVMEHESFESEDVAALMNELFVCIKVDREEYPDVDHVYMNAVQAMTGSGGWPLNVFVLPDKRPFFGGTYFPPQRAFNRASWREVLINISQYFTQNRNEVEQQAGQLTTHLQQMALPRKTEGELTAWDDAAMVQALMANADLEEGGFGGAPKFPSTFALTLLAQCSAAAKQEAGMQHVYTSLEKMARGGIYDQLRGGFARYSTDRNWFAPHFEKMLYDNALLLPLYAKAWHDTKNPLFWQVIEETLVWLEEEMSVRTKDGLGFYSAQDADSEGVEGLYYTWTAEELRSILGEDYTRFARYYGVTEEGNWEHRNILFTRSGEGDIDYDVLKAWKSKLLSIRYKRIPPLCDDKVILSWNALMNKGLQEVYVYTAMPKALAMAEDNMRFLLAVFEQEGEYKHTWKQGVARIGAYADDLAYWADALIGLGHLSGDATYYGHAEKKVDYLKAYFHSEGHVLYDFTHREQQALGIPHRDTYDGALPSANAVLAGVLHRLGYIMHKPDYDVEAGKMIQEIAVLAKRHPSSFAYWMQVKRSMDYVFCDISVDGAEAGANYVFMRRAMPEVGLRWCVRAKPSGTLAFTVCKSGVCSMPVPTISEALGLTF
ncbi:MAG: thioredoxin domain-containing protein [Chitinophagaceae bacterium]